MNKLSDLSAGDYLPNGARLVDVRISDDSCLVLAFWPDGSPLHRAVSWRVYGNDAASTAHGHYYSQRPDESACDWLARASEKFLDRAGLSKSIADPGAWASQVLRVVGLLGMVAMDHYRERAERAKEKAK